MPEVRRGVVLDLDGTLVDTVFHHVLAWDATFTEHGLTVPLWRVQRAIGLPGPRLVSWVTGRSPRDLEALLDALVAGHERTFLERNEASGLHPTAGATALLADLEERDVPFVVATSATGAMAELLLAALGRTDLTLHTAEDVAATKPAPDPLLAACASIDVEPEHATMIGDAPYDAEGARRAGARAIAVRCGGFGDAALREAGAWTVVDAPVDLLGRL